MANGKWQMANGKWQMADGRWQMADGRWQMADGRCGCFCSAIFHEAIRPVLSAA
jgi:hypothetical protein